MGGDPGHSCRGILTFDNGAVVKLSKHMSNISATMCVDNPIRLRAQQAKVVSTQPLAGIGLLAGVTHGIVEPLGHPIHQLWVDHCKVSRT